MEPNATRSPSSKSSRLTAPALFIGHGSPMLAIDPERGAALRELGRALPRPESIVVVSAHWEDAPLTFGTTAHDGVIYDFGGFPDELRTVRYDPPGAPELVGRVESLLGRKLPKSTRGLDHGVWTPFVHLWPAADIPVLQLSLPRTMSAAELVALGRALAPLRAEGVALVGSGNLTHNLRAVDWRAPLAESPNVDTPEARAAAAFDSWVADVLSSGESESLADAPRLFPDYRLVHPTDEHWRPLLFTLGATMVGDELSFPVLGWELGVLSRRSVLFSAAA